MEWWIGGLGLTWVLGANLMLHYLGRRTTADTGSAISAPSGLPPRIAWVDPPTRQAVDLVRAGNRIGATYLLLELDGLNFREAQAVIAVVAGTR